MNLWKHKGKGGLYYLAEKYRGYCGTYAIDYYTGETKSAKISDYIKVAYMGGRK